ncbi:MAG TPA: DUF1223 domain-containing protein [Caulobacteraceae bacterium]|nr:DUF1223 domain-containing protein [Caulobacteraceae bacterium]
MPIRSLLVPLLLAGCSASPMGRGPMVVELFQSQGCSSCPPADANLASVADRPDVIALSFAVTYWNQLGWKDTFSEPVFTQRQWDYAHAFAQNEVFTPEVVVDGRRAGVGVSAAGFGQLLQFGAATRLTRPAIRGGAGEVELGAGQTPAAPADVWLVRYDPRVVQVAVGRGENAGKTLPERNIVRELTRLGVWTGAPVTLRVAPPGDPAWRSAILVQSTHSGPILAAAKV